MATISGGERLAAKLRELAQHVTTPANLRVGFLEGGTAPDGMSMPFRAALNEYGVPSNNQPPRPFFRNMIADEKSKWGEAVAHSLRLTNYDASRTMGQMGELISGQLRKSITTLVSPPLSPVTIAKKGFDKPLIEYGDMLNAVAYEVH